MTTKQHQPFEIGAETVEYHVCMSIWAKGDARHPRGPENRRVVEVWDDEEDAMDHARRVVERMPRADVWVEVHRDTLDAVRDIACLPEALPDGDECSCHACRP